METYILKKNVFGGDDYFFFHPEEAALAVFPAFCFLALVAAELAGFGADFKGFFEAEDFAGAGVAFFPAGATFFDVTGVFLGAVSGFFG
jgi:hypothetical protein